MYSDLADDIAPVMRGWGMGMSAVAVAGRLGLVMRCPEAYQKKQRFRGQKAFRGPARAWMR